MNSLEHQPSLFDLLGNAYSNKEELSNNELYKFLDNNNFDTKNKDSNNGCYNLPKRKVRWLQQTLKQLGLLSKVNEKRGYWKLTNQGKKKIR